MPLNYALSLKNARLAAVRDALSNGTLELWTVGAKRRLAVFKLPRTAGTILAGVLQFNDFPQTVAVEANGVAVSAQLKDVTGVTLVSGLRVGLKDSDVILGKVNMVIGNVVKLDAVGIQHF